MYFSVLDGGLLTDSKSVLGLISDGYGRNTKGVEIEALGEKLACTSKFRYRMREAGAEVLCKDEDGNVIFSRNRYGKGWIYYLGVPVEQMLWESEGKFTDTEKYPYYKLYQTFAGEQLASKPIVSKTPEIGLTVHQESEESAIVVAVNYASEEKSFDFALQNGWELKETLYGSTEKISRCDMSVFRMKKSR